MPDKNTQNYKSIKTEINTSSNYTKLDTVICLIEKNINNAVEIAHKSIKFNDSTEESALFLNLSDQELCLTNINLQKLKEILNNFNEKITFEEPKEQLLKKIILKIDQINTQSKLFRNIIGKYLGSKDNYKYYHPINSIKEEILKELEKDKTHLDNWEDIKKSIFNSIRLSKTDFKLFIFTTSRILQKSKELIDLIRKELEKITFYIKAHLKDKLDQERRYFSELSNSVKLSILKNSQLNILSHIKRVNRHIFILLT